MVINPVTKYSFFHSFLFTIPLRSTLSEFWRRGSSSHSLSATSHTKIGKLFPQNKPYLPEKKRKWHSFLFYMLINMPISRYGISSSSIRRIENALSAY